MTVSTLPPLILFLLGAPSTPSQAGLELKKAGVLRVLIQPDVPRLYKLEDTSGLEADLLKSFAQVSGLKLETVLVPNLGDRIPWLLEDRGDMIAGGLVATEARRRQVDFTAETFPIRHVVVTRKPMPVITSLDALRRERVGTVPGTSWAEQVAAAQVPKSQVDDSYPSIEKLMDALRRGTITATVMSVVWAMEERETDPNIQLGLMVGPATSVAFAVRKDQPRLLAALNEHLRAIRRTDAWSRLVVKYFGHDVLELLRKSRE